MSDASQSEREDRLPLVPAGFEVPLRMSTEQFVLEPLGPQHNELDHTAWTSSVDHIRATPGFAGRAWPQRTMSLEENLSDLQQHAADFSARRGFAYTVLDPAQADVIGCVYFYPPRRPGYDVDVRSWVRTDRAELDGPLWRTVSDWLESSWPFTAPDYAPRE